MNRTRSLRLAVVYAILAASPAAFSQDEPDLSGTWKMVGYDETLVIAPYRNGVVITQRMHFEDQQSPWQAVLTYSFDESETRSVYTLPNGTSWIEVAQGRWADDALDVDLTWETRDGKIAHRARYYLKTPNLLVKEEIGEATNAPGIHTRAFEFERVPR